MGEGSNPLGALLGFWMLMQLVMVLLTLIGGLYGLWCLNRLASSAEQNNATLERLAAATERLAQQNGPSHIPQNVPVAPSPIFPAPIVSQTPVEPVPFTPGTTSPTSYTSESAPQTPSAPENRSL